MQLPVLEQIRQNVLTTLRGISIANTNSFDAVVIDPLRVGDSTADGALIPHLGQAERNPESNAGMVEWVQEFLITTLTVATETNQPSADGMNVQKWAEVLKALQADPTRGDWAHDTTPEAPEWFNRSTGQHEGAGCIVFVRYRTNWNDPFTVR